MYIYYKVRCETGYFILPGFSQLLLLIDFVDQRKQMT